MKNSEQILFPKGFFWGGSTSAHQVEGNNHNDWSEWETSEKRMNFLRSEGLIEKYGRENFISGGATGHYHCFREDFQIAKELGHNATRFSIEWSRIEPQEGQFNEKEIEHYKEVIAFVKGLGMEPFITLWHWTIPLWLRDKGGWQCGKAPEYFTRYVEKISAAFGSDISFWITLNEPEIYAYDSYISGVRPPQKKSLFAFLRVIRHLVQAHCKAYKIIKKTHPTANIGIAKQNVYFETFRNKWIYRMLKKSMNWLCNIYFLQRIKDYQDFIGLNYYFRCQIPRGFDKSERRKLSDMGWELYPQGIYHILSDLKCYNTPIYITENGLADARDKKRSWFIFESLKNISKAIHEGVDVRGYLYWSLLDNFEWDKGYWPKFGLLEIDHQTLERRMRPSAIFYRDICSANGITAEILHTYKNLCEQ